MMPDVLIAGAGPSGLVLACELAWRGVAVRVVDRAGGPSPLPKAVGVLPRTLELLERHGVTDEMVRCGLPLPGIEVHGGDRGERILGRLDFGMLDSAYPYVLSLPQAETERILLRRAGELGVEVEWGTRVTAVQASPDAVRVTLARDGAAAGSETVAVPWLAGCDGGRSTVRAAAGIPFRGERITQAFKLADATVADAIPGDRAHLFLSAHGVLFMVPLRSEDGGRFYLVLGEEPGSAALERPDPTLDEIRALVGRRAAGALDGIAHEARVTAPRSLGRFRIQRYLADTFRRDRVLLVGDAAHVHPPSGAQGMNSGIQDAVNLGWKLALVSAGQAPASLLDTYDEERRPLARTVQAGATGLLRVATIRGAAVRALRDRVLRAALATPALHRRLVEAEAGLAIRSAPRDGRPPRPASSRSPLRRGDRAPDVWLHPAPPGPPRRLHDSLDPLCSTLLVFAGAHATRDGVDRARRVAEANAGRHPALAVRLVAPPRGAPPGAVADPAGAAARRCTGGRPGLVLIRPDRYVAVATAGDLDTGAVDAWLAALRPA